MAYALVGALVLVVIALVALQDRKDARCHTEREAERAERQILLQRIQAPEVAVAQYATGDRPTLEDSMPLSDEELQEERERMEALDRLERIERMEAPWLS